MAAEPYRFEAHSFKPMKRLPWQRCVHCGLLTLKNEFTQWAIRMGCNNEDHPQHAQWLRKAGRNA